MPSSKLAKNIILVAVATGLLPLIVASAFVYHTLDAQKDRTAARVLDEAKLVADGVDREMGIQAQRLRAMAGVGLPGGPELWYQPGPSNPLVALLNRQVLAQPGTVFSMLVGVDGSAMGVSSVDDKGRPSQSAKLYAQSFREAPWFTALTAGDYTRPHKFRESEYLQHDGGILIAGPHSDAVFGGAESMLFAVPVQVGNEVLGYWVQVMRFSRIEESIRRLALEARMSMGSVGISLLDSDATLLLEFDERAFEGDGFNRNSEVIGATMPAKQASLAIGGNAGVSRIADRHRDSAAILGYTHLRGNSEYPGVSWSVLVQVPEDKLFAGLDVIWETLMFAILAAIPVFVFVGVLLSRPITRPIAAVAASAKPMAAGDFSGEVPMLGDGEVATMGQNLNDIAISVSRVLGNVKQTSEQIIGTSGEVSGASSALADNASRSAAALEQISASMATLSKQTKANAESATSALDLATTVSDQADESTLYMQQMVSSMDEISVSSERISQIIKVIDEIAFQTNLLALNAAVEAARAGQHGKGFAVVAEEVRTLAARSAKAARETSSLIQDSLEKVEQGSDVALKTADSLGEIVVGIGLVSSLMSEVASASSEQAGGISEIDVGLMQVDCGVQGNTASAEELAASARELSARAHELKEVVAGVRLRDGRSGSSMDFPPGSVGVDGFADDFGIVGGAEPSLDGDYDDFGF